MRKALQNSIHNATAGACKDFVPPPEMKDPDPIRRSARLVAIAIAGALLVIAIVVTAVRIPKLQSEKKSLPSNSTQELVRLLGDAVKQRQNINCPCKNQVMSWCNVTTFYLLIGAAKDSSTFTLMLNFTKDKGGAELDSMCNSTNPLKGSICQQILSPVLNIDDSRTFLQSASAFTSPELLYKQIATRIDTNAYVQSSTYYFLDVMNTNSSSEAYIYSQGLTDLVRTMQFQFLKNSSSSLEDYWKAAEPFRKKYNMRTSYGMDVSWELYLQTCKPAVCDIEYEVSPLSRVLRAASGVGGLTTVITLTLRFFIWPALTFALRFPSSTD